MNQSETKLIGKKQMVIFGCSISAGIGFHLYRQHYENGMLTKVDFIAAGATVVMAALIFIFMAKKGNKN